MTDNTRDEAEQAGSGRPGFHLGKHAIMAHGFIARPTKPTGGE